MRALGLAVGAFFLCAALVGCGGTNMGALSEREVAMRILGEYLQRTMSPQTVVLISNPYSQMNGRPPEIYAFQKASEAGLRDGLKASVKIQVEFPALKPEALANPKSVFIDPTTKTPLSFLVAENGFEDVIRKNPGADVVVSLIGLPVNVAAMPSWTRAGAPRFALLLPDFRIVGDGTAVRSAFKSGKLAAAVIARPKAPSDERISGDYKAEFEKRFILLTADNIDQHLSLLFR